jgi:GNAT superfamily N-acetyltransferase
MSGTESTDGPAFPERFSSRHGDVEVRGAVPEDFEALDRLLGFLVAPEDRQPGGRAAFGRILADRRRMMLVATRHGRLVGTLDVVLVDNVTHGGAPWVGVENVVADPDERRSGVGRALMDGAFALARGAGCYKVQLLSGAHRAETHRFYEAMGFDAPVRGFRRYL